VNEASILYFCPVNLSVGGNRENAPFVAMNAERDSFCILLMFCLWKCRTGLVSVFCSCFVYFSSGWFLL